MTVCYLITRHSRKISLYTISYHDGAQVVSYGLDKALGRFGVEPRDTDLFKKLSENYASHIMEGCQSEYGNQFKTGSNGVTNGAEWYSIAGTSTDYQYIKYRWVAGKTEFGSKYSKMPK